MLTKLSKRQSSHHIETSQLICSANQLTGFYMMGTLAFNELRAAHTAGFEWLECLHNVSLPPDLSARGYHCTKNEVFH